MSMQSAEIEEPMLDWRPVAEMLKVKERALWNLVRTKGLPCYRIGKKIVRFKLSEVAKWAEQFKGAK